jgi:hypothetical protein
LPLEECGEILVEEYEESCFAAGVEGRFDNSYVSLVFPSLLEFLDSVLEKDEGHV